MTKIDKKEILASTIKSMFGVVPLGGAALNELIFDYNGRIKQKRLNKFVEILAENFTEDSRINIDNIKTEDFNDLFEAVLQRVVKTKSESKLRMFKDILVRQLNNPSEHSELNDHYLDLISNLTTEEISILYNHRYFTMEYEEKVNEMNRHKDNLSSLESQMKKESIVIGQSKFKEPYKKLTVTYQKSKEYIDSLSKFKTAGYYGLTDNVFVFYKQRLFSKGLLIDDRMKRIGNLPFSHMGITEFGIEFIEFIKNSEE
ncbi:hypothetical protein [uncultured Aquimarina sp.]|uniref:hypothetical protein n=1 Tax=uncultured Aquimarina sp. TaxID=575652 RepID=UPI00260D3E5C|nr:hypothetical protein [uncultured Aquimarina sp.]